MRALVIVHDPGNDPGLVGDRLRHHGFELDELAITVEAGNPVGTVGLDDPSGYDLILPMGSVYSVYDEAAIGSWIADELDLLRRADAADVPILGICFGAQALAASLGGRVVRAERHQVGWFPLTPSVDCGLPEGPWMQWHYDRFEPPAGATVLAEDEVGVQAFSVRRHLGLQFHPEVTATHLAGWVESGGAGELEQLGIDPEALIGEAAEIEADVTERVNRLVDWFLTDVAKL